MPDYNGKKIEAAMAYIQNYIKDRRLSEGQQIPTESQLSTDIGVSRVTVRRALSMLREHGVLYSIHGSGHYVGEGAGDSLLVQEQPSYIVPLIISNMDSAFRGLEIIQGAQDYLSSRNCKLTVNVTNGDSARERQLVQAFSRDGTECMMIMPTFSDHNADMYFDLIRNGSQLVFIDKKPNINCNYVASDNIMGGYLATKHLIEQGHERIAFLSRETPVQASSVVQRAQGYHFALREHGLPVREDYELFMSFNSDFSAHLGQLLSLSEPPTAIFALNDGDAIAVLNYLHRHSIRVPEEMALIGFDNLSLTAHSYPTVSSVDQPFYRLGCKAAEIALKLLTHPTEDYRNVFLPVTLIPRESTAQVRTPALIP